MKKPYIFIIVLIILALGLSFTIRLQQDQQNDENLESISVFFSNSSLGSDESCERVFPVDRPLPENKDTDIKRYSLENLLRGPSQSEKDIGYSTSINEGVVINSLDIKDGNAFVDFNSALDRGVAGSCRVIAIRAQIVETLIQFADVSGVVISVDGDIEEVLQP